jgi:hypothetical protein
VSDQGDGTFVWDSGTVRLATGALAGCSVAVDVRLTTWGELASGLGSPSTVPIVEGLQHRSFQAIVRR